MVNLHRNQSLGTAAPIRSRVSFLAPPCKTHLTLLVPDQSKVRTWTDRSGSFKVEAEFIGLRDEKIHLHKLNGVKIAVPVPKMSLEDIEYVERATGVSLDELKPLSDIKGKSLKKTTA